MKSKAGPNPRGRDRSGRDQRSRSGRQAMDLKFVINSELCNCSDVQKQILAAAKKLGLGDDDRHAIRLASEEGLINAIKHGNRLDSGKKVIIEVKFSSARVQITIEDQGGGFDRAKVPDPTLEENLERSHGRGILLIESYMDSVRWSKNGRRVTMTRRIDAKRPPYR